MSIRTGSVVTIMVLLSAMGCSSDQAGGQSASDSSQSTDSGALGSSWADAAKMPDVFSGQWMLFTAMVESDEKLNVPFTPTAQKYVDAFKYMRDIPYAQDGCATPGVPISMRAGPITFSYKPGLISIYMQAIGHTRFIKMNQEHGKTAPKYYGNSVGHWEGDTLVVETVDFLPEISFQYGVGKGLPAAETFGPIGAGGPPGAGPPDGGAARGGGPPGGGIVAALSKAIWGPHGEGMRMVERMRLVNPDTLEISLTIYDDTVWTQPYVTAPRKYTHITKGTQTGPFNGDPDEWVCTVSITSFDPDTNTYVDKDPVEMVKYLDKLGR